ncbi:MAG: hypothetical protein KF802_02405 [Bdellovibrionaceae bacterium]|nr:hypothetical protein [Pseudobdellovibrionaceae bacterium]
MAKTEKINLGVSSVAVVSINDGSVETIVNCELLGLVVCRVIRVDFNVLEAELQRVENEEPLITQFTLEGFKEFQRAMTKLSADSVRDCYLSPNKWVVAEQYSHCEILVEKELLDDETLSQKIKCKPRFPLFKDYAN